MSSYFENVTLRDFRKGVTGVCAMERERESEGRCKADQSSRVLMFAIVSWRGCQATVGRRNKEIILVIIAVRQVD